MNTIKPTLVALYSDIFDSPLPTLNELLNNYSRDAIISICCFINSKFYSTNYRKWEFGFLDSVLKSLPINEKDKVIAKFNEFSRENNQNPVVFSVINSLLIAGRNI